MKKRIIAFIAIIALLVTMCPVMAMAAEFQIGSATPDPATVKLDGIEIVYFSCTGGPIPSGSTLAFEVGDANVVQADEWQFWSGSNYFSIKLTGKAAGSTTVTVSIMNGGQSIATKSIDVTVVPVYTVTFDADGGTPEPEAQEITKGEKVTEPEDPEKEGYVFGGWFYEDTENQWNFDLDTVNADTTLTAAWTEKEKYTVTFDANGGTPEPEAQIVEDGGKVLKPETDPVREGYTFGGWFQLLGEIGVVWDFDNDTVADDMDLIATWEEVIEPVEFDVELSQKEFTYNGQEKGQVPEYTVKDKNGDVLEEGTDYTVSVAGGVVSKQINAGEVEIRFIPTETTKDEYKETTATYTIKPAELKVTLDKTEFTYDGDGHVPEYTVEGVNGEKLEEGKDYHVSIAGGVVSKQVEVGTVEMVFYSDNANYKDATATYEIVAGSNNPKTGDSNNMWLYAAIAALALVAMGGVVLKKKADR